LGLRAANDPASDGTFFYDPTVSYTFDPNNQAVPGEYPFIGIAEHEISEVMGRIDGIFNFGSGPAFVPYDLFYYTGVGVRLGGPTAPYFSIDNGVTDLHAYNNFGIGDLGDWGFSNPPDSYDVGATAGSALLLTPVDLTAMNVIGYNLAAVPEPSTWALLASGFLGLGGLALGRRKRCQSGGAAAFGVGSGAETGRQT